jgi:chitodextrinase
MFKLMPSTSFLHTPIASLIAITSGAAIFLALPSTLLAQTIQIANSEINYSGASSVNAFTATEPYVLNIMGTMTTIPLNGAPRTHDFSGNVPFINPKTGKADPYMLQAWNPTFAKSFNPPLSGTYDLENHLITNTGFPGRIEKKTINGQPTTMVRYNAGDGMTENRARSQLNSFAVPPRTRVRWDFEVTFGNPDGQNDWTLTPTTQWVDNGTEWVIAPGGSPVLIWQLSAWKNPGIASMNAVVDTDSKDPSKLMITFTKKGGKETRGTELATAHGIARYAPVSISIEAFLDERESSAGGKGAMQIWVNNKLLVEHEGPTLTLGSGDHTWQLDAYLYNEAAPYKNTRATFWKTAKMRVFPKDSVSPTAPANLTATAVSSTTVNLAWTAASDNDVVAGYKIYRGAMEIGTAQSTGYVDSTAAAGTTYAYSVKAYDNSGNLSAVSNVASVQTEPSTTSPTSPVISISSSYAGATSASTGTVSWTTNVPSKGTVYYGTTSTDLSKSAIHGMLATQHQVGLTGLNRRTTYYYKIVSTDSNGKSVSSAVATFRTPKR